MSAQQESGPPSLLRWMREGLEIPGLIASPLLPPVPIPAGQGQPVMVLPGYLTTDTSSVRLRRSLGAAGYAAYGWATSKCSVCRCSLSTPKTLDVALSETKSLLIFTGILSFAVQHAGFPL